MCRSSRLLIFTDTLCGRFVFHVIFELLRENLLLAAGANLVFNTFSFATMKAIE